jgi:preprotein translocase subunit YajC
MRTHILAASGSSSSSSTLIIFIVVAFAVLYFVMIRPQQRRRQNLQQQQNTVLPGATVRTTAGMYATVVEVDGDDVVLEVAPGIEVRYMRRAIMDVVAPAEAIEEEEYEGGFTEHEDGEESENFEVTGSGEVEGEVEDDTDGKAETDESAYEQATGVKQD